MRHEARQVPSWLIFDVSQMKNIGTTSSGTVIVEMTAAQFAALSQLQVAPPAPPAVVKMSIAEMVGYVRERIAKLSPKKKEGVVRSISAMFQFNGGIPAADVEEVIRRLQKEKFFAINETGRVTYKSG